MTDPTTLPCTPVRKLTGGEKFRCTGLALSFDVLDFWQWSTSDLLSNATRGVLAEFIVANALGLELNQAIREEWAPYDLMYEGITIQVKSAAYVQSWYQEKPSRIVFNIAPARAWDKETNKFTDETRRQADLYIFCLLAEQDKNRVDPLDLDQWRFIILPAKEIDRRFGEQRTVSLSSLERLGISFVTFAEIQECVRDFLDDRTENRILSEVGQAVHE